MDLKIALAGNPNSGKTTLFNALTGSNQFVGNWPGVTIEKKEGRLKGHESVRIIDLPGVYSLSPYTLEEELARRCLIEERPDVILNIVDGTNLERNLYLTNQLMELGIPLVIAVNMMDVVQKRGDRIDIAGLSEKMGCTIVEISALKGTGITEAASAAIAAAEGGTAAAKRCFSAELEQTLSNIEGTFIQKIPAAQRRWYAVRVFERDAAVTRELKLDEDALSYIDAQIQILEHSLEDDAESIIANERYLYITTLTDECCRKNSSGELSSSDRIDAIVTNRWAALPIFAAIMFLVYYLSVSSVGAWATDWANDGLFGNGWHLFGIGSAEYEAASALGNANPADYGVWISGIPVALEGFLESINCAPWLQSLLLDGIVAGVGAVLGFVPQLLILFLLLGFLESCGYMARIAFVMDRVFRGLGLSGKSFIPMLIGTGCSVPGIMASRTIENERDRRMTIMTTTFIPCGAKLPIIGLIAGAMFGGAWWVAPSAYFLGILAVVLSGVMLKKTKLFAGERAAFVMELPAYRLPTIANLLRSSWERGWSFIKKAGTTILLASILIWFTSSFGVKDGSLKMVEMDESLLAAIGSSIAFIFTPLGWGNWQGAVATITGLAAKENIVGTFGILFGGLGELAENGKQIWGSLGTVFTPLSAYSFLVFNLLCAPCFAAIGAIKREMNSSRWTFFAIAYQCLFAYAASLLVYQLGMLLRGEGNVPGSIAAFLLAGAMLYMLFRGRSRKTLASN